MNARSALHLGLASTFLMAIGIACSAPDPGQVTYTQRIDPSTGGGGGGGNPAVDGGGGGGGGTDSGGGGGGMDSGGGGGTGAWAGAPAYAKGTTNGAIEAVGQAGHAAINATKDPSGMNCMASTCHGAGGTGSPWGFAGTAYISAGTPVAGGVEIRVIGSNGTQFDSVYTDSKGNFWSGNGAAGFPAGAAAGARDGKTVRSMPNATLQCNNTAACHLGGANPMMHP